MGKTEPITINMRTVYDNIRLEILKDKCNGSRTRYTVIINDITIQEWFKTVCDEIKKTNPDDDILNVDETNENAIRLWVKLNLNS